jgi:hypothetical protein
MATYCTVVQHGVLCQLMRALAQHPGFLLLFFERHLAFRSCVPAVVFILCMVDPCHDARSVWSDHPPSVYFVALHLWLVFSFLGGRKQAIMAQAT